MPFIKFKNNDWSKPIPILYENAVKNNLVTKDDLKRWIYGIKKKK